MTFLKEALSLAELVKGKVSPRPPVGAIIVNNSKIVGKGSTSTNPVKHAEIVALEEAGQKSKDSILYTTLEPCSHHGSTPPCVESIIKSGIRKVVTPLKDPNPEVNGKGLEKLKTSGIEVSTDANKEEIRQAEELIEGFKHFTLTKKPFITVKYAMTLDGKISSKSGNSSWISNKHSRNIVHKLRSQSDAVLIGINTLLTDNPRLNARNGFSGPRFRVVLDSNSKTPKDSNLFEAPGKILIYTTSTNPPNQTNNNVEYVKVNPSEKGVDISTVLEDLANRGCINIFVEGGKDILGSFFDLNLVNKVIIFISPKILGGQNAITAVGGEGYSYIKDSPKLKNLHIKTIKDDIMVSGYLN
ncbi:MAG: bifunctional diaminohydroxyphosphoribosylaminopyrimidine deaminase/5-amino-6-(5-phosphoribosylamino)uracil reductase RibD [Dehalococcoidia bacterium]|jgi:diaminohydroxyphosphoribosylaminopyrimidine deaminase/5-amino-6-(5-phosphoribosylamino)uracil reductase|nr:bifunctional diaminohydroxyphosphoribosylaminopyrimidine deaminase/5-amino-6-(5-phosphoribosylamino)uracil reductase RibD [Dehalococcoidia bacterium]HJN59305.1 bifunctional diaminohydroxyphosphoribosylaminopyrimidine deaminase/5-amino-6-(5-phosphoribosylamino)uracil reductase RibD [Dehalococcoidia bacterium]